MRELPSIADLSIFIVTLLISIVLHEMMHAAVAYKLGDDLAHSRGRISFNPLNHIDPLLTIIMPLVFYITTGSYILAAKPVPINTSRISGGEYGFALVALAGPMTNFALALLAGMSLNFIDPDGGVGSIVTYFIGINVGICAFNLLPLPPLDGSRVLYAVAPDSVRNVMNRIEQFGIVGLIVILLLFGSALQPLLVGISNALLVAVSFVSGGAI